jgi:hypothetical protein
MGIVCSASPMWGQQVRLLVRNHKVINGIEAELRADITEKTTACHSASMGIWRTSIIPLGTPVAFCLMDPVTKIKTKIWRGERGGRWGHSVGFGRDSKSTMAKPFPKSKPGTGCKRGRTQSRASRRILVAALTCWLRVLSNAGGGEKLPAFHFVGLSFRARLVSAWRSLASLFCSVDRASAARRCTELLAAAHLFAG